MSRTDSRTVQPRHRLERAVEPLCQSPGQLVLYLIALNAILWSLAPSLVHTAPPIDVVEGYMWGREWVLSTYKHPAMPSWFVEASRLITGGATGWPVYIVSQMFVAATLWLVYCLGRDLMDAPRGAASAISLMALEYISWMSPQFNHNIVQLPFWVAAIWCVWRAVEHTADAKGKTYPWVWWIALGAVAGLGLYAKLSHGIILIIIAGWMLLDDRARRTLLTPGPWLAAVVCLTVAAPLLRWLVINDFQPLTYAADRGDDPIKGSVLAFFPIVALMSVPVVVLASATSTFGAPWDLPKRDDGGPPMSQRARTFLLIMAIAPFVLTVSAALLKGAGLRPSWTAPMTLLLGPALIMAASGRWGPMALVRQVAWTLPIMVIASIGYMIAVMSPLQERGKPMRFVWPEAEISKRFDTIWTQETGRPLKIVVGNAWTAGIVGMSNPSHPSILSYGNFALAPWVTPERLRKEGALVVWEKRLTEFLPATTRAVIGDRPMRFEKFWIRGRVGGPSVELGYVVVPPQP
jgi:4-amino-4-deoxy-L-arabinose transferase-like glycosyltransferase